MEGINVAFDGEQADDDEHDPRTISKAKVLFDANELSFR